MIVKYLKISKNMREIIIVMLAIQRLTSVTDDIAIL